MRTNGPDRKTGGRGGRRPPRTEEVQEKKD